MFKKRSKPKKASLRRKQAEGEDDDDDDSNNDDDNETRRNLQEAVRANKKLKTTTTNNTTTTNDTKTVMHHYETSTQPTQPSAADLATSTAQHHPTITQAASATESSSAQGRGNDGIFRHDSTRNKFLAGGPMKASAFVRTTCRFDYQPDICKDYKDTGFCGFGDTCIYLHDRGDTFTGWQLEQEYQKQKKKDQHERELNAFASLQGGTTTLPSNEEKVQAAVVLDDGLPFACHLCRKAFTEPVVTSCGHYFCQACIMQHIRQDEKGTCPICGKDTHGVLNQPTKLLLKKRRLLSNSATWQEFADASRPSTTTTTTDNNNGDNE